MRCVGEHDRIGDRYLPALFLCQSVQSRTTSSAHVYFHSHFTLRAKISPPGGLVHGGIYLPVSLWTGANQWQHPSAAIAMAAGWNLLCGLLPVCHSATALRATSVQTWVHGKLISLTSFPHSSTSQRFLLMWQNCFTVKRCFLFLPGNFQCKDSTCDVRRWEMYLEYPQ